MSMKEKAKILLGRDNLVKIKKILAVRRYFGAKIKHTAKLCEFSETVVNNSFVIERKNAHVFFGYYDIKQVDTDGKRALIHVVPEKADPAIDSAVLAWVDFDANYEIHEFAITKAWSWQQGARLRWHPVWPNCVIFNDFDGKRYVTKVFDLKENKVRQVIPVALYDINCSAQYGLSLNFDRLQRLRPGYGYSKRKDETAGISRPSGEGITLWDGKTNSTRLIISLEQLTADSRMTKSDEHYINHISISPSGNKFLFFHLWTSGTGRKWFTDLYVSDIEGCRVECIESNETVSHYDWLDDETILVTALKNNEIEHPHYIIYKLNPFKKEILSTTYLNKDGHPTWVEDGKYFLTDTYPQNDSMQYVFVSDKNGGSYQQILRIYSNPFAIEEHRCDLHPRVDEKNHMLCVDTSFKGNRSVLLMHYSSLVASE